MHAAYRLLGDFPAATAALDRIKPTSTEDACELALTRAMDFGHFAEYGFYRSSAESKAGLTYEVYREQLRDLLKEQLEYVLGNGASPEQKERAHAMLDVLYKTHEGLSLQKALENKARTKPEANAAEIAAPATGAVSGTVRFESGEVAAGLTVTLGLKFDRPFPDPATHLDGNMGGVPEIGPVHALTALTDAQGRFRIDAVPADRHEFLAVTLDPVAYDIPTRFLQHGVEIKAGENTATDLTITEWKSAPPPRGGEPVSAAHRARGPALSSRA